MFGLVKARTVSRSITGALAPYLKDDVALSLQPDAPVPPSPWAEPGEWLHPRVLGFLSTLVTLMAERRAASLPDHALASVQSSVLGTITGAGAELIGAELCLLSSSDDADFLDGAAAGFDFFQAMEGADHDGGPTEEQIWHPELGFSADAAVLGGAADDQRHSHLQALWDQHVTQLLAAFHR